MRKIKVSHQKYYWKCLYCNLLARVLIWTPLYKVQKKMFFIVLSRYMLALQFRRKHETNVMKCYTFVQDICISMQSKKFLPDNSGMKRAIITRLYLSFTNYCFIAIIKIISRRQIKCCTILTKQTFPNTIIFQYEVFISFITSL